MIRALFGHFLLTLQLNFRSTQAIVYGYFVPLLFLLAFASVFRGETPLLFDHMGQLLTLTILGGACFGLPTGIVSERERGVWRRYRLLPIGVPSLLVSTLLVRVVIVVSAAAIQILLARWAYGTPFPTHLGQMLLAFLVVTLSFMGLGLLIAALANDVPAVQALGQCLFLPMIMIGGVGVPLGLLPEWARNAAAFMPGRYAVEVLQRSISESAGLAGTGFSFVALAVIGIAAGAVGVRLFRWEGGRHLTRSGKFSVAVALLSWIAVGGAAVASGHVHPHLYSQNEYRSITDAQIASITFEDLPGDNELYTRLAPPLTPDQLSGRLGGIATQLKTWRPGLTDDLTQRTRNLLSVAAIADVNADLLEGEIARVVFDRLEETISPEDLKKIVASIILSPDAGTVVTDAREFGVKRQVTEKVVRERNFYYAKKLLGRLVGKIRD